MDKIHFESGKLTPKWVLRKFGSDEDYRNGIAYEVSEFAPNLLLNEGITEALKLIGGITATAFSNANAYLGVGDSSTAASAAQTGLQAATNKFYKAMDVTFPSVSGSIITYRSTFASGDANFAWNEFTIANGNSDSSTNLNRLVSSQGTKQSGQTWELTLQVTLS